MSNTKQTILMVEDEIEFAEIIRDYLEAAGFAVELAHSGSGIVDRVRQSPPALILLDLMLPGVDGPTICNKVRMFSDLPIIMLTARVDELDRLLGYDIGADDYICKPVKPREILARVKTVLRRFEPKNVAVQKSMLEFDEERFIVRLKGQALDLTPLEFRLLQLFANKEGRVFSRTQIMDLIYQNEAKGSDRAVDSHIKNLRKKMCAPYNGESPIQSVYGIGYKLEWPN